MQDGKANAPQAAAACDSLDALERLIPTCGACPRLRTYCAEVASEKVKRFATWNYHGRPVPGFGDPQASILIVGLAPAAHGANRTGRLFTGDRSGDFLFAALHRAGLASQPNSDRSTDGLRLHGVYIGVAGRCAPPANRPTPEELTNCLPFLQREIEILGRGRLRVIVALGGMAHDAVLRACSQAPMSQAPKSGDTPRRRLPFSHGAVHLLPLPHPCHLLDSYHVSQQNTFTGRLTPAMLDEILSKARQLADAT